ncbi:hypothetical protein SLE2022_075700 [Rubroshorea leprosula]
MYTRPVKETSLNVQARWGWKGLKNQSGNLKYMGHVCMIERHMWENVRDSEEIGISVSLALCFLPLAMPFHQLQIQSNLQRHVRTGYHKSESCNGLVGSEHTNPCKEINT